MIESEDRDTRGNYCARYFPGCADMATLDEPRFGADTDNSKPEAQDTSET
jgi:hypothetical protein